MAIQKHPKIQQNESGDLLLNFGSYGHEIEIACFSADGRKLLTVEEVGTAKIWETASNDLITQITPASPLEGLEGMTPFSGGFKVFIESAALNPDGSLALLGLNDGTARLFAVATGEHLAIFSLPGAGSSPNWGVIRAVNFSPDGSLALVGFYERKVGVWETKNKKLLRLLTAPHGSRLFKKPFVRDTMASSLAAAPGNRYIFAGFADLTAVVWDLETGATVFEAHHHIEKILDCQSEAENIRWATSAGVIYEAAGAAPAKTIFDAGETWLEAKFSPDGQNLLCRTLTGTVKKWSVTGESERLAEAGHSFPSDAELLAWTGDGRTAIYVEDSKKFAVSTNGSRADGERSDVICAFAVSPQEDCLVTVGWSKSLELWEIPSARKLQTFIHESTVSDAVFSPCGNLIAAGSLGQGGPGKIRSIYVWNTETGERVATLRGHTHQVHALAFGPDSRWLVSAGLDDTVRFWNLTDQTDSPFGADRLKYGDLEFHHLKVLNDGRLLVFRRETLEIWKDGEKVAIPIPFEYNTKWLVTGDEKYMIIATRDQLLRKWDLQTGRELEAVEAAILRPEFLPAGPPANQNSVGFEPAAGGYLWRTGFGNYLHTGDGPRGWSTSLPVSQNGELVIIPGNQQCAVMDISQSQKYASFIPFGGRLRAACILPDRILLINSAGKLLIHEKAADGEISFLASKEID